MLYSSFIMQLGLAGLASASCAGAAASVTSVGPCCAKLHNAYPGQVVYPKDAAYAAWNERWADSAELPASCIFRPLHPEDVSFAMKTLSQGAGNSCHCAFSIKGGGHTPWPGANSVRGGVAIDLGYMNQTIIADDKKSVNLGTGTRWHDAYQAVDGAGIVFLGGRCPDTGVGGLTLGGGYSWFSGAHGFVTDNIINFEVVLASGDIVNANKDENSDLFKALKGGGNNFGVVTSIDIIAFEHSQQVYGGLIIVPESKSDEVLTQLQAFTDDSTGVDARHSGLTIEYFLPAEGEGQILLWVIDTEATSNHEALQPFFNMEPKLVDMVSHTSIANYPAAIPPVSHVLMSDVTFVNDLEVIKAVHKITMDVRDTLSHVPNLTWDFQFEPLPRHFIQASNALGGNVMGLDDAQDDLLVLFIMPLWDDPAYSDDVNQAAETWYNSVKEYTKSVGKDHPFVFANYASPFQDPMGSYGTENKEFLDRTSEKYDPTRLFQRAVGGFKL